MTAKWKIQNTPVYTLRKVKNHSHFMEKYAKRLKKCKKDEKCKKKVKKKNTQTKKKQHKCERNAIWFFYAV